MSVRPADAPSVLQSGAVKPLAPGNRSVSPSVPQVLGLCVSSRDTFSVNGLSVSTGHPRHSRASCRQRRAGPALQLAVCLRFLLSLPFRPDKLKVLCFSSSCQSHSAANPPQVLADGDLGRHLCLAIFPLVFSTTASCLHRLVPSRCLLCLSPGCSPGLTVIVFGGGSLA